MLRSLNIITFVQNFYTAVSKFSFAFISILAIFFVLFNSDKFSKTSLQSIELSTTIIYLTLFGLASFFFAYYKRPKQFKKDLFDAKAFIGAGTFAVCFIVFGIFFQSFEGRIDTSFVTGILSEGMFLFVYMYIVAFWEEAIFRLAIMQVIKSVTKDIRVRYSLGAAIFSLYHYLKYQGDFFMLFFAFIAGLGFVWLTETKFGNIPSFPISVALHLVYNLYIVGALKIVLSVFGVM